MPSPGTCPKAIFFTVRKSFHRFRPGGQIMKTLLAAVVVLAGSIPAASGQNFPSRPVTLVVPFAAGGPVDTIARILSVPMAKTLGQPVLVESVTGAAGTLGVCPVARAAPHRFTLSIGQWITDGLTSS